jgi:hypothetical protein
MGIDEGVTFLREIYDRKMKKVLNLSCRPNGIPDTPSSGSVFSGIRMERDCSAGRPAGVRSQYSQSTFPTLLSCRQAGNLMVITSAV